MKNIFVRAPVYFLVILWSYAAVSKLLDFDHFEIEMQRQTVYPFLKPLLIYLLPPLELVIAGLLGFEKMLRSGLYISLGLLCLFSGYIALVLLHFFNRVPCSCGGILEHMGWGPHLVFNLTCLILITTTLIMTKRKEVSG